MEAKKSPKADLERKRGIFFEIGLILSLFVVFVAFEWPTKPAKVEELVLEMDKEIEEEIMVTREEINEPPPPKEKPKVEIADVIEEIKNEEVQTDIETSSEVDEEEEIEIREIEEEEEEIDEKQIFVVVEQMPSYPGGNKALMKFLSKNIKYPQIAADNGIQGKVYLKFVIERNGSVGEVIVLRGVDKSLDKEAVRVVKSMPKWKPGKQRGKAVRVWFNLPVVFRLQ